MDIPCIAPVTEKSTTKQVWVKAVVWHPTNMSLRMTVVVLIDTGAGGGDYASKAFVRSIEQNARGRESIMSTRGRGLLRAANPTNSAVPPMDILGSTDIPLVFPPEDQVRNVTVRVVEGLPYGLIVGAAFLRQNGSMINFADAGGFRPTPGSPWVSFVTAGNQQAGEGGLTHQAGMRRRLRKEQKAGVGNRR